MVRPGHGRRAGPGDHARARRRGPARSRYIERATLGFEALAGARAGLHPSAGGAITGLSAEAIVAFARRYGGTRRTFIRVGIGLSRHDNGGMTCRTLACLPALTGAYADPHGGALLGAAAFALDSTRARAADLMPAPPRVINMIQLGRALTDPDLAPPVKALYVYNSNPAAVCPNQELVLAGLRARTSSPSCTSRSRPTPPTTRTSCFRRPPRWSTRTSTARSATSTSSSPSRCCPRGERDRTGGVRRARARHGDARRPLRDGTPPGAGRRDLRGVGPVTDGITHARLRAEHSARLAVPRPFLPFADGAPTPRAGGALLDTLRGRGCPALPTYAARGRARTTRRSARAIPCAATCRPTGSS